ncbi:hypothetical protein LIER_08951 [Lithospermum erythrorhizon]|uniref:Aminotransferase-like plant mobile domain-containing protein n=1 Tax=Lithospermum erythrorhizon TaxID=34254 RepID=A0AAV3PE19_LITER
MVLSVLHFAHQKWAEDVLSRCGDMLANGSLTGAVQASLCVYDCSDEFLKAFCENWCPSINTLIILQGELSISLWDLLELGGLSVTGRLFDELVPTAECLSQSLSDEVRIPESCGFLLSGYHYLAAQSFDGRVSISAWMAFGTIFFGLTHPFDILWVGVDLEDEVYCAAFLACWLCFFVLPVEPLDLIRSSVFNMASFIANGLRVGLTSPVASWIYKSLSQISLSDNPSAAPECFHAHSL